MRKLQNISDVNKALEKNDFIVWRFCILVFVRNRIFSPFSSVCMFSVKVNWKRSRLRDSSDAQTAFVCSLLHAAWLSHVSISASKQLNIKLMTPRGTRCCFNASTKRKTFAQHMAEVLRVLWGIKAHVLEQFSESETQTKWKWLKIKINNRKNSVSRIGLIRILVWSFSRNF